MDGENSESEKKGEIINTFRTKSGLYVPILGDENEMTGPKGKNKLSADQQLIQTNADKIRFKRAKQQTAVTSLGQNIDRKA
ncbi:MAG: hypothetical protein ACHQVK_00315 [Candidatus Paceibacterales bacterium]